MAATSGNDGAGFQLPQTGPYEPPAGGQVPLLNQFVGQFKALSEKWGSRMVAVGSEEFNIPVSLGGSLSERDLKRYLLQQYANSNGNLQVNLTDDFLDAEVARLELLDAVQFLSWFLGRYGRDEAKLQIVMDKYPFVREIFKQNMRRSVELQMELKTINWLGASDLNDLVLEYGAATGRIPGIADAPKLDETPGQYWNRRGADKTGQYRDAINEAAERPTRFGKLPAEVSGATAKTLDEIYRLAMTGNNEQLRRLVREDPGILGELDQPTQEYIGAMISSSRITELAVWLAQQGVGLNEGNLNAPSQATLNRLAALSADAPASLFLQANQASTTLDATPVAASTPTTATSGGGA